MNKAILAATFSELDVDKMTSQAVTFCCCALAIAFFFFLKAISFDELKWGKYKQGGEILKLTFQSCGSMCNIGRQLTKQSSLKHLGKCGSLAKGYQKGSLDNHWSMMIV